MAGKLKNRNCYGHSSIAMFDYQRVDWGVPWMGYPKIDGDKPKGGGANQSSHPFAPQMGLCGCQANIATWCGQVDSRESSTIMAKWCFDSTIWCCIRWSSPLWALSDDVFQCAQYSRTWKYRRYTKERSIYTLETCPTVEICSKTRPNRYFRSEVRQVVRFPQGSHCRTGNYRHNLLDSHRKWYSSTHCPTHRHSRGNRNSRRSCQQSVIAIFLFFYVFLWVRNCLGFFQLCFFFSVHFHRFLQHFGAGNCYFNDMCNIVDVKPLCFFMFFLSAKFPSFRGDPGPKVFVSFLLPLRIFATAMQPLQCVLHQHVHIHSTCHHFPLSPLPLVTTLVTTSLSQTPSSPPFVITLRHHFPQSPPFVAFFYVVNCCATCCHHFTTLCQMYWCVMCCYVMRCDVMWCVVTTSPPFVRCIVVWCIVMWCKVTWIKITRSSENCFPTSFDNIHYMTWHL